MRLSRGPSRRCRASRRDECSMRSRSSATGSATHEEIVSDRYRVSGLLGGPPPDPAAPGAEPRDDVPEDEVEGEEVVLGEEVQLERRAGRRGQRRVRGAPWLVGEAPAALPRNVVVREPFSGCCEVPVEETVDEGLDCDQRIASGDGHAELVQARSGDQATMS